jgi:hypothetical protein
MSGERLALWWVERYTRGLEPATRDERRAEVASDVWEHRAEVGTTRAVQLQILGRCLRGAPADLSWRRSRLRRSRTPARRSRLLRGAAWAAAGLAYAFLVGQHAWFATALVGLDLYGGDWAAGDVQRWSRLAGVFVLALVGGALLLHSTPRLGAVLVGGAALGTAALMWWALPLLGPMAVAVAAGAAVIARRRLHALRAVAFPADARGLSGRRTP